MNGFDEENSIKMQIKNEKLEKNAYLTKETASKRFFLNKIVTKCNEKLIYFLAFFWYFKENRVKLGEYLKSDEENSIKMQK